MTPSRARITAGVAALALLLAGCGGSGAPPSQAVTLSEVMPQSMTVKGSVMTSGGAPSAGTGFQALRALQIPLRFSMIAGQRPGPAGGSGVAQDT